MSLILEQGTLPAGLQAKSCSSGSSPLEMLYGSGGSVHIGSLEFTMGDFLSDVVYDVLMDQSVGGDNVKTQFVRCVESMSQIEGFNGPASRRFSSKARPQFNDTSKSIFKVGEYDISVLDLFTVAYYALTNTDIEGDSDPRIEFVKEIGLLEFL